MPSSMTAARLLSIVAEGRPDSAAGRGRLQWARRQLAKRPAENAELLEVVDRLLRDPAPRPDQVYTEPWRRPGVRMPSNLGPDGRPVAKPELTAADVASLQITAGMDPAKVPDDEVVRLASLRQRFSTSSGASESDRALVQRVAGRVLSHHEAKARRSELQALAGPAGMPPAPWTGELEAVTETLVPMLTDELDQLTPAEAKVRVHQALTPAFEARARRHETIRAAARAELDGSAA